MSDDPSLGEAAYNAYCGKVEWKGGPKPLPFFTGLSDSMRNAWEAAANAAVDQYESRNIEEGKRAYRGR